MEKKEKDSELSLLGIIESLVDNLQETNSANTTMLRSIDKSMSNLSEKISEDIEGINNKIKIIDINFITESIREINTKIKLLIAVSTVLFTVSTFVFGLVEYKAKTDIVNGVVTGVEKIILNNTETVCQRMELLFERNKK